VQKFYVQNYCVQKYCVLRGPLTALVIIVGQLLEFLILSRLDLFGIKTTTITT